MIRFLLRLYPPVWRARYEDEVAALLESRHLGPFDVADLVLCAIDAQLNLRGLGAASETKRGASMSLRIGGAAAIVGGVLFAIGFAWASSNPNDDDPGFLILLLGIVSLLVGLIGLSAFQARRHPVLVWTAFAIPAVGIVSALVGMALMSADGELGWNLWALGLLATVVGSFLFGLVTFRTNSLPRPAAALLAVGSIGAVVAGLGLSAFGGPTELVSAASVIAFAAGWIGLGVAAMRAGPSTAPIAA